MNILPITYNIKTNNIHRNIFSNPKSSSINFRGNPSEDTVSMKTLENTCLIYRHILRRNFKEAHRIMSRSNGNYDPNYIDPQTGEPLLLALSSAKPKRTSAKEDDTFKDYMMQDLINHKDFAINKFFPKRYKGIPFDTTYAEEAVARRDLRLMMCLRYYGNLIDPNGDSWQSLINKASEKNDKNMELFLREIRERDDEPIITEIDRSDEIDPHADETKTEKEKTNEKGAELLERAKVIIPESIPASIDEVGGLSEAKKDIENYVIKPWKPEIHEKLKRNHIGLPNGFLMYGPPGCGKTYITQVIAKQTGYPLYLINTGLIGSKWISQTSINLNNIFDELRNRYQKDKIPSILFFDEIDDMGMSREGNNSAGKREDLNAILMLINNASEQGIIVIGATNFPKGVDEALLRSGRLDKKIEIKLPTDEERKDIITKLLQKSEVCHGLLKDIDTITKKTEDKTPADIAKYINNAGMFAIYADKPEVTLEDFFKVMEEVDLSNKRPVIGFNKH